MLGGQGRSSVKKGGNLNVPLPRDELAGTADVCKREPMPVIPALSNLRALSPQFPVSNSSSNSSSNSTLPLPYKLPQLLAVKHVGNLSSRQPQVLTGTIRSLPNNPALRLSTPDSDSDSNSNSNLNSNSNSFNPLRKQQTNSNHVGRRGQTAQEPRGSGSPRG